MPIMMRLQVYILAVGLQMVLLVQILNSRERQQIHLVLFKWLLISTMGCTVMEAITWIVDGGSSPFLYWMNRISNMTLMSFNTLPMIIWIMYLNQQILGDYRHIKKQWLVLLFLPALNIILSCSSPWTGFYFDFTEDNIYYRGDVQWVAEYIYYMLFGYSIWTVLKNRKRVPRKQVMSMILFLVPPLVGLILQAKFFGVTLVWAGVTVAVLIAYISLMTQTIQIDHLTGLYNRRQLDYELEHRIMDAKERGAFAAMMMDIDDFKLINDELGHLVGDRAIETTAMILKKFFNQKDFVARYAGDEFVVILEIRNRETLDAYKKGLQYQFEQFNKLKNEPYILQLSIGCDLFDPEVEMTQDAFLHHIDALMYQDKLNKKKLKLA